METSAAASQGALDAATLGSPALPAHSIDVMISEEQILRRVQEMGEAITRDFPDPAEPLLLVGVLKGATLFIADLVRSIRRPVEFDFVAISSYGAATKTSGEVRILKDLDAAVAGKHVLIVEDIIDTGLTLRFSYLIESLRARHARSVGVCVLLDKPSRRRVEVPVNYCGFEIPDRFVIGYGMDYAEHYRHLRYIGILHMEEGAAAAEEGPDEKGAVPAP
jgi:hypoxanthine phosphoribosyltransferase